MSDDLLNENDLLHRLPLAGDEGEVRRRHEANRLGWNEGAARYTQELEEAIAFLKSGGSNLHPIERRNLGDLRSWCKRAIHLQCASGRDTLSLWNEGVAEVIGVDISDVHIANARRMSAELGIPAQWLRCDILDTPHELDGTADLVYTGRGALCWLHDLQRWAQVIRRLLKPGGTLHLLDDHPVTWLFDSDAETLQSSGISYFDFSNVSRGWPSSYIGEIAPLEKLSDKFERLWTFADIFQALSSAGLVVEKFGEHREEYWDAFPNLKADQKALIPMTFSIVARCSR